jgi:hypothetical protein
MMRKNGVNVVPSKMEYNQRNQRKLYNITKVEYWRKYKTLQEKKKGYNILGERPFSNSQICVLTHEMNMPGAQKC